MSSFLFTSESVSEGHPDKVADQISDAILDAILAQEKTSRVAAETLCNTGLIVLAGEITTRAVVDYAAVARGVVKRIGYDNADYGMDYRAAGVLVNYDKQSPDIAQGVDEGKGLDLEQGAGDQGLMFGYACDETPQLMPLPIHLAHRLVQRQSECRRDGRLPWLGPDAKSQVTVRYVDGKPDSIDTVVLSSQHLPDVDHKTLTEGVIEHIVKPVLPKQLVKGEIKYHINPTGRFVVGGPHGDCGLTGRKIIVDTYGGAAPPRRRRVFRQGPVQGRPLGRVRRALRREERGRRRARVEVPDPGVVRDRHRAADERLGRPLTAPARFRTRKSPSWCSSTSISARRASSRCSTSCARSTRRPPRTATSGATSRSSPGRRPTRRRRSPRRRA